MRGITFLATLVTLRCNLFLFLSVSSAAIPSALLIQVLKQTGTLRAFLFWYFHRKWLFATENPPPPTFSRGSLFAFPLHLFSIQVNSQYQQLNWFHTRVILEEKITLHRKYYRIQRIAMQTGCFRIKCELKWLIARAKHICKLQCLYGAGVILMKYSFLGCSWSGICVSRFGDFVLWIMAKELKMFSKIGMFYLIKIYFFLGEANWLLLAGIINDFLYKTRKNLLWWSEIRLRNFYHFRAPLPRFL